MDDRELRVLITSEMKRLEDNLGMRIELIDRAVKAHSSDRFAHGWDHQQVVEGRVMVAEWEKWRAGVDRWRFTVMGGLGFLSLELPVIAGFVIYFLSNH